ncbi:bacterioferritin [Echinimonas agarilytica]|uniref:Bacterioferritin n=1 Tax=Echinimonas agarilytica TaxID=1215918 RepID=A0AA42B6Z8_9GAMM|nr:bacterioferritin [Echinimonas agarilytica]MCM2679061.1 bacterioferritin [Echinimonas agarilytica]
MKGNANVIDALNRLLAAELAAMDQYFIHSEMYADWGLTKLYDRISHEFDDEKGHAKLLIERILFLEGTPCMTKRDPLRIGSAVPEMLEADLQLEYDVAAALRDTIEMCEKERDYQTRNILGTLLEDTEQDHAYWLEQQLGLIKRIGLENYQQSML